ncbi:BgTH12-00786 [Blumeria graminis f. sp. triticale]|uniref:BgTH12-00786 n=1 Tax=Blumeria graminis f. sp. triticale TaxID=1689686 RepID=A0A9W4D757_BLUGR|nr:BgTH12-00786 [Blumeria graminis f. sp. triticale]
MVNTVEDKKNRRFQPIEPIATFRHPRSKSIRQWLLKFALTISIVLLIWCFPSRNSYGLPNLNHRNNLGPGELEKILLETPDEGKAKEWSRYYTSGPHLAGKNYSQAEWTKDHWQLFGIDAEIVSYHTFLNYPLSHRLALLTSEEDGASWRVKFEAGLTEDTLEEDPTTRLKDRIPTFHGYSASGNVTAPYIYVNYGAHADYEDLIKANITLEGKIALARYGNVFRGLKVKRAQELGMVGVVIFTDPGDDGMVTTDNGIAEYPKGPARQPSSVQRGSTQFLGYVFGDPTTPGYPSKPGVPRQPVASSIPSIPSVPISYIDAIPFLKSLNGYGPTPQDLNKWWQKNLGLKNKGVQYHIGPSPPGAVMNLVNEQDYVITPIWNVIGVINGTIPDEVIVIGNHRDAWIVGGAGDPNSGSAALNEVIRSFGQAVARGWKPMRTIVFASWDGEEYGLLGSTEWVEEYLPWLSATSVAYINVDIGTTGPQFFASASPLLNEIVYEITSLVPSPNQTVPGQTVADLWDGKIETMGSGSDFTAFQDIVGIPSLDIGFGVISDSSSSAIYHYHSNYDSFYWMNEYGDPGFLYHATMARLWALLTAKLADAPVIPFRATDYATALQKYISKAEARLDILIAESSPDDEIEEVRVRPKPGNPRGSLPDLKSYFIELHHTVHRLHNSARRHDAWATLLANMANQRLPWWKWLHKRILNYRVKKVNNKYKFFDRAFLHQEGLDGRPLFKHVVFAPDKWSGYSGIVLPGLIEAIDARDWTNACRWGEIIKKSMQAAHEELQ